MKEVVYSLNFKDVRKCRNSAELNELIEKHVGQGNPSKESFREICWNLFEEWKKALKAKLGSILQRSR